MAELTMDEQRREMAAFSQWAWHKEGEPVGCMLGQAAAREAWLARAALAKDAADGVMALPDCGACPGDGTICPRTCRLAEESPPIAGVAATEKEQAK